MGSDYETRPPLKEIRKRRKIDWSRSKRLTKGSLLAITNKNGFLITFAVVYNREKIQSDYDKQGMVRL